MLGMSSVKILWVFPLLLPHQVADLNHDGCTDLADFSAFQTAFEGPTCSGEQLVEMVLVPGGGAGPEYDFYIGKYEITQAEYHEFFNAMDRELGLVTQCGSIQFNEQLLLWKPGMFWPQGPVGGRYRAKPGTERFPVIVSPQIAMLFCNWLTRREGLGEPCYDTTSADPADWRPTVMDRDEWRVREPWQHEKELFVRTCRGYRLPIAGWPSRDEASTSEWLKAVAYHPSAPAEWRKGSYGRLPAHHWRFGCQKDTIDVEDANVHWFCCSTAVPLGVCGGYGPSWVGYFDGKNWVSGCGGAPTNLCVSYFGLFDGTGNVSEWVEQRVCEYGSCEHVCKGGSFRSPEDGDFADVTYSPTDFLGCDQSGFRIVRVPEQEFPEGFGY